MLKLGPQELLVVLLIVLILFGPTQLPKLSKMFGKSIKSFRSGLENEDDQNKEDDKTEK
ncbi:MAG: twin-arginine translocase TatA/TatE family subunit [Eubacteriales bacterium]|nr:twin-arginine translocase TatA/TatE family subunit [Eubacteriales bacterium]